MRLGFPGATGTVTGRVRAGCNGPVHCTEATCELGKILLSDCGRLQEEDAERSNRRSSRKHTPALPLGWSCQVPDYRGKVEFGEAR